MNPFITLPITFLVDRETDHEVDAVVYFHYDKEYGADVDHIALEDGTSIHWSELTKDQKRDILVSIENQKEA